MKNLLYIGGVLLLLLFLSGERETDLRRRLDDEVRYTTALENEAIMWLDRATQE